MSMRTVVLGFFCVASVAADGHDTGASSSDPSRAAFFFAF